MKTIGKYIQEALVKHNTTVIDNSDDLVICKYNKYESYFVLIDNDETLDTVLDICKEKNEHEYNKLKQAVERYFLNVKDRTFDKYVLMFEIDRVFDINGRISSWDFVYKQQFKNWCTVLGEIDVYDLSYNFIKDKYEAN